MYHAALLDYIHGSGESGLARAYELGRLGLTSGSGVLHLVQVHEKAVKAIVASTDGADEIRRRVNTFATFLLEALAAYEMAHQGYRTLVKTRATHHSR